MDFLIRSGRFASKAYTARHLTLPDLNDDEPLTRETRAPWVGHGTMYYDGYTENQWRRMLEGFPPYMCKTKEAREKEKKLEEERALRAEARKKRLLELSAPVDYSKEQSDPSHIRSRLRSATVAAARLGTDVHEPPPSNKRGSSTARSSHDTPCEPASKKAKHSSASSSPSPQDGDQEGEAPKDDPRARFCRGEPDRKEKTRAGKGPSPWDGMLRIGIDAIARKAGDVTKTPKFLFFC